MIVTSISVYDFYNNINMDINVTAQLKIYLKLFEISENSVQFN